MGFEVKYMWFLEIVNCFVCACTEHSILICSVDAPTERNKVFEIFFFFECSIYGSWEDNWYFVVWLKN